MDNPEKLATLGTQDEEKQKTQHNMCIDLQSFNLYLVVFFVMKMYNRISNLFPKCT